MRILFWKGPVGLAGRLIRLKTGAAYSHCELLFSEGERFAIDVGAPARFYKPGYAAAPWDPKLWDCIEISYGDEMRTRMWCLQHVGATYDWRGIVFCQVFPWGWEHATKYFCSELCVEALQAGGYPQVTGLTPYQLSPAKLAGHLRLAVSTGL